VSAVRAVLAFVVLVNGPAAVAVAAALAPPGRPRRRLVAGAAAVAAAVLVVAAAVSGPLLDALDVAWPSAMVSAGALAAVGALLVLVNGSWGDLAGERSGGGLVVPLAVPVLAGPGTAVLAVALAARDGTLLAAGTAVAAVALSAALAVALDRAGAARPWLPPLAARLVAAAAVAAGVERAVEGVLGV
jgi:small neutral amino acid transporter SnatA (MarC family)